MIGRVRRLAALLLVLAMAAGAAGCLEREIELTGTGATFPAPLYARWMALFHRVHRDIQVRYKPAGSSAGIAAIAARTHDFAGSDALPSAAQLDGMAGDLLVIPMALGPVVLAYNLPDFEGTLTLSGPAIADIYLGRITRWDDPAIGALNPDVDLPDLAIHAAMRSDGSGTTAIFTGYLSKVSAAWRDTVGQSTRVRWPTGTAWSGEGNDGVAQRILLLPGGIGYLEMRYAQNAGLHYAAMINRQGVQVEASVASVQAAEENTPAAPGHVIKPSIADAPGAASYPIAGTTYALVYRDLTYLGDPKKATALVAYLRWCLTEGQEQAPDLHYTPLPAAMRRGALDLVDGIDTGASAPGS